MAKVIQDYPDFEEKKKAEWREFVSGQSK